MVHTVIRILFHSLFIKHTVSEIATRRGKYNEIESPIKQAKNTII
jgi:hypothetical protein